MKQKKGFAVMDKKRHLEVASRGGKRTQATGKAYRWTSQTAKEAVAKALLVRKKKQTLV